MRDRKGSEEDRWLAEADVDALRVFVNEANGSPDALDRARRILAGMDELRAAVESSAPSPKTERALEELRAQIEASSGSDGRSALVRTTRRARWAWAGALAMAASVTWVLVDRVPGRSGDDLSEEAAASAEVRFDALVERRAGARNAVGEGELVMKTNNPNIEIVWILQGEE